MDSDVQQSKWTELQFTIADSKVLAAGALHSVQTIHTRCVMGLKKRSLSLVGRGKPCTERYKRSGARRLRARAPNEERPRLFRARHGAGERVV
jgi:hypothetical protein